MDNKRLKLLLCGKQVTVDNSLIIPLEKKYDVVLSQKSGDLKEQVSKESIALILFELSSKNPKQLGLLKMLKSKNQKVIVIALDDRKTVQSIIDIFNAGATDVFPTPYNTKLLVERIDAILK